MGVIAFYAFNPYVAGGSIDAQTIGDRAVQKKNGLLCNNLIKSPFAFTHSEEEMKALCFRIASVGLRDPNLCEHTPQKYDSAGMQKSICFKAVAIEMNDQSVCNRMTAFEGQCHAHFAQLWHDRSACTRATKSEDREWCYTNYDSQQ